MDLWLIRYFYLWRWDFHNMNIYITINKFIYAYMHIYLLWCSFNFFNFYQWYEIVFIQHLLRLNPHYLLTNTGLREWHTIDIYGPINNRSIILACVLRFSYSRTNKQTKNKVSRKANKLLIFYFFIECFCWHVNF